MTTQKTFWVTNVSDRNVSLADLNITIPSLRTMNLLDKKHHKYTLQQLQNSENSGSIFNKRDKIKVRHIEPAMTNPVIPITYTSVIPSRARSIFVVEERRYEELELDEKKTEEEKFAADNSYLAELDDNNKYIQGLLEAEFEAEMKAKAKIEAELKKKEI